MSSAQDGYYLPQPSHWPVVGSLGLALTTGGFAMALPASAGGEMGSLTTMYIGFAVVVFMLFGWFGVVAKESESGAYNAQVDRSFRMGMGWFIFSEVMFFAAFFGVLFYMRVFAQAWQGGESDNAIMNLTHDWLYSEYKPVWPHAGPTGGEVNAISPWGIPALNTALLLASSVTVTIAHHALRAGHRGALVLWLLISVVLGFIFIGFQVYEYIHLYSVGVKLTSGAYGSTFYMLTGFHGLHVTIGAIILLVILVRCIKGHFKPESHFGFEAAAWYWHFVDVVWLGLFIFVYIL